MGDTSGRSRPPALQVLGRFVVVAVVPAAVVVAGSWVTAGVYRLTDDMLFYLTMLVIGLAALVLHGVVLFEVAARESVPRAVTAVASTAVLLGASVYGVVTPFWTDLQVRHERGVAVTGIVERRWSEGVESGGPLPGLSFYLSARAPDGTRWTLAEPDPRDERFAVGRPVLFTYDPRHEVRPALGPVPGAPPWAVRTAALYLLCAGSLTAAAACTLPPYRRPEKRLAGT
ncbi:hypothetical protein ACFCX4_06230 [Kitasatospora sp. NPDC056327]|uniref:hypothetical protein n=1 Tax=Kitasatospora sp. NPDC056327 TaxID=3345785 RepID=UPI0035DDC8CA